MAIDPDLDKRLTALQREFEKLSRARDADQPATKKELAEALAGMVQLVRSVVDDEAPVVQRSVRPKKR